MFIVFVLLVSSVANAKWLGTQILTIAGVNDSPVTDTISLRGSAHMFSIPGQDFNLLFGYVGPRFKLTDWFWTAPQVGSAANWTPDGGDAFLTSVWNGITLGDLFIFLEWDVYFYEGGRDYYGYYFLDYNIGQVTIGPQIEHVNEDTIVGPHVTFYTNGGQFFSTQYYVAAKDEFAHTVRFVAGLFF
ncbi:hypothetical protein HY771_02945 [Candidatus Uhrbacteria bacterium]|nr:hypothetical protein [Candidatus Uhrbacteria bacterium]